MISNIAHYFWDFVFIGFSISLVAVALYELSQQD